MTTKFINQMGFVIEEVNESSRSDALMIIQEVFTRSEPVSVWIGLSRKDWEFIIGTSYYQVLKKSGISVIARSTKTNKVIATNLSVDMYYHMKNDFWGKIEFYFIDLMNKYPMINGFADLVYPNSLKLATYARIGEELMQRWLTTHCPPESYPSVPGRVLKDLGCAVLPEYQGHGIAQAMTKMRIKLAIEQGFHYLIVTCTSKASRMVHEKQGFKMCDKINYDEFQYGGRFPYRGLININNGEREYSMNLYDYRLPEPGNHVPRLR